MSSNEFSHIHARSVLYSKLFVQSNSSLSNVANITEKNKVEHLPFDSNIDAKVVYENIVGTKAFLEQKKNSAEEAKSKLKIKDSSKRFTDSNQPFNFNLLMKACESNNVTQVQELCRENKKLYISLTDEFGWTPLMSACCAGAKDVVKLILQWGPDVTIKNKKGNTCWDLAKSKGHLTILQLLKEFTQGNRKGIKHKSTETPTSSIVTFYCKVCKQNIKEASVSKHESSVIHLFNSEQKSNVPTTYGIPESNKGFQILLKSGWDKEKGLGPEGAGHKFPPKTVLKQDKTGLGAREYQARVTHFFSEEDKKTKVKHSVRTNIKKEKRNEKRLEKKLRQMLS